MNYNYQLNNIATQYRKFSKGQRVEDLQFNEFLDFFEDQDRLSRVMLEGVGIVCGLEPQPIYENNLLTKIKLSQGVAITTDGDLLTLNKKSKIQDLSGDAYMGELKNINISDKEYTHWRVYDNSKAMYPPFHTNLGVQNVQLWELATAEEATTNFQPLATLGDFDDKYLLLYLESYEKEVKPCRGVDCDNHGIQQIRNLKVLVTTHSSADRILAKDNVFPERMISGNVTTVRKLKRVILTPQLGTPEQLKQAYKNIVTENDYGWMFSNIDFISEKMNIPLINRANFVSTLNQLADQSNNFQYAYDVLKDLAETFAEIVKLLPGSFTKSLPDVASFPKHVILGKLLPIAGYDYTRHNFYNSPVLDSEKKTLRVRTLIERFNQLILAFRNPTNIGTGVVITPSMNKSSLGDRSIPFYYETSEEFLRLWNFDKTSNRAFDTNLNYNKSNLSTALNVQMPLDYNIDKMPYYLIEGHQGGDYHEVIDAIQTIKNAKQLGFEVMSVSLTQLLNNKDFYKADFADYVGKNPALEHKHGVHKGGTFVVVYKSESDPYVIADFALPYICCTPKTPISLSLPSQTVCKNGKPMVFTVNPPNGEVKAAAGNVLLAGVTKINGQYLFDPDLVEPALLNQEISFTVNGKPTNCKVRVLPIPAVTINAVKFDYPEGDSTQTVVTFKVSNQNGVEYDYKWDFLGNGSYVSVKPDDAGNVKNIYFAKGKVRRNPVNVLVTAGNGCSQMVTLTNWYVSQPTNNNTPPTVALSAIPTDLYVPGRHQSKIYREVTPGTGTIPDSGYIWSCDDPNVIISGTSNPVGATFPYAGVFTVKLTVKDSNNLEGSATLVFDVKTQVSITNLIVTPSEPSTNDIVNVRAVTNNPSNIQDLQYEWYLDGERVNTTSVNEMDFGPLDAGERKIDVLLSSSAGWYHSTEVHTVIVQIQEPVSPRGGTSFLPGTKITMENGSLKNIEEIKKGDRLKSYKGSVTVIRSVNYKAEVNLYRLNEEVHFITGAHPVRTTSGWRSYEPEKTRAILPSFQIGQLSGDIMLMKAGDLTEPLQTDDFISGNFTVYNLEVNGTLDYFANGYSVHSEIIPLA
ncbi:MULTISPECIES: Hint domain-containing protein [unclassified Flavobacterium]|uniref:Hint domain-containing protein n=1 Tax=unclassified Flavobacterium TaxID=196869 RepID=UPI0008691801|nr:MULTISPECIES: Hint domain-containing protein [unclassified Flavobacterium]MBN9284279.1 hypothetical protein [Flavobacterium sp.]ODS85666.1 MAG: hypothetical protein ABS44_14775 [Chryseobacterium sp. SCN 40-13]OJV73020.1 MAG: hypothetical protein BGO42_00850 [Flavobacterium sp. 40-81]